MIKTTCKKAGTPKACPKKVTEPFYVTHPKAPKALMGLFLTETDAECGRVVMRSADALVTASLIDSLDDLTYRHAVNNGRICRTFAGAAKGAT
jgi:hypothetical protein